MKIKWLAAAAVGAAVLALCASASAAAIVRTFDVTATDFFQWFGSDPTLPPDPVHLNFTLTFDNGADVATTTTGLAINAFDLPYAGEFQYLAASDIIALGTDLTTPGTCASALGSFCFFLRDATSAAPTLPYFSQFLPTNNGWIANSVALTYQDHHSPAGVDQGPGVPEPDSWALMILGFGGLGSVLRRRRSCRAAWGGR